MTPGSHGPWEERLLRFLVAPGQASEAGPTHPILVFAAT